MAKRNARKGTKGSKSSIEIPVRRGSENVYADLGFENPAEELAKAELALTTASLA